MPLPDLWRRVYNSNIISMKWRISNARPSRSSGIFGQDRAIDFGDAGRAGKRPRDAPFGLDPAQHVSNARLAPRRQDRQSLVLGTGVSVLVDHVGRRIIKNKITITS